MAPSPTQSWILRLVEAAFSWTPGHTQSCYPRNRESIGQYLECLVVLGNKALSCGDLLMMGTCVFTCSYSQVPHPPGCHHLPVISFRHTSVPEGLALFFGLDLKSHSSWVLSLRSSILPLLPPLSSLLRSSPPLPHLPPCASCIPSFGVLTFPSSHLLNSARRTVHIQ